MRVIALQVAAGNQLFHIVVDNDEIATQITGHLKSENGGRATFIPLNRLNPQELTCVSLSMRSLLSLLDSCRRRVRLLDVLMGKHRQT